MKKETVERIRKWSRNYRPNKGSKTDKTSGIRSCKDKAFTDMLIRNTYRTLLSRGQKGCFIYCEDRPLLEHMARLLNKAIIE